MSSMLLIDSFVFLVLQKVNPSWEVLALPHYDDDVMMIISDDVVMM